MRKRAILIVVLFLLLLSFALYRLYYIPSPEAVRSELEAHLDQQYSNRYDITRIEKDYSADLFHQPIGYRLWLREKRGAEVGPVLMQFNETQQGWITYGGTSVEGLR